jgi:molybdopterin converting factor small subunit
MQVRIKLMGMLKDQTPMGGRLELPEGATIEQALRALNISLDRIAVCTVNGQLERNWNRMLADGDEFTALPPVGGG